MKVIYNSLIPFKGFKAINLFGVLFVRKGSRMCSMDYRHEAIHTAQIREMLYLFFYPAYILEWLFYLFRCMNSREAYRRISFEREAYAHQGDADYLKTRKKFNQYRKENLLCH